ncbi:MAG: hypothetical protein Kow00117_14110 [Phototrophicales bacterium]
MVIESTTRCTYTLLDNGIHHFMLHENTAKGIDELVRLYEIVTLQHQADHPGEQIRVMMEFEQKGAPPVMYAEKLYKEMMARHPKLPKERIAYVHQFGTMMSLITLVIPLFPNSNKVTRKFFPREQKETAIMWLLSDNN